MSPESFERALHEISDEVSDSIHAAALAAIERSDERELWALASGIVALPDIEQREITQRAKKHFGVGFSIQAWKEHLRKHRPKSVITTSKTKIKVSNRDLDDVVKDCIQALEKNNTPPRLFWRNGTMVQMQETDEGRPCLREVNAIAMRDLLARAAVFVRGTSDGGEHIVDPPRAAADGVVNRDGREIILPALVGVVEIPTFRSDGTVIDQPGYDELTRLYYRPCITFGSVPSGLTSAHVQQALDDIEDVIYDFPFDTQCSRANAIAMMLLPICRNIIAGPTPLAVIEAPAAGSGKSMLAQICSVLATGSGELLPWKDETRENEVSITSALLSQKPVVVLDNVTGLLGGGSLCAAITSASVTVRPLGGSEIRTVDVRSCWIATANNARLGDDMSRRIYRIRLDAKTSQPMQRTGFRHAQLLQYVGANRARLVMALTVLVRWWFEQGCPLAKVVPLGSFEQWHITMASILECAGVQGFLGNLGDYLGRDESTDEWMAFLEALHEEFDDVAFSVADIGRRMGDQHSNLKEVLPPWIQAAAADKRQQLIGSQLRKYSGTRLGVEQIYCDRDGQHAITRAPMWRVRKGAPRHDSV